MSKTRNKRAVKPENLSPVAPPAIAHSIDREHARRVMAWLGLAPRYANCGDGYSYIWSTDGHGTVAREFLPNDWFGLLPSPLIAPEIEIAIEAACDAFLELPIRRQHFLEGQSVPPEVLKICLKWIRTPGGRGRNTGRWQATPNGVFHESQSAQSEAEAVGRVILSRQRRGEPSAPIVVQYL